MATRLMLRVATEVLERPKERSDGEQRDGHPGEGQKNAQDGHPCTAEAGRVSWQTGRTGKGVTPALAIDWDSGETFPTSLWNVSKAAGMGSRCKDV